jgi:hypothetical protein
LKNREGDPKLRGKGIPPMSPRAPTSLARQITKNIINSIYCYSQATPSRSPAVYKALPNPFLSIESAVTSLKCVGDSMGIYIK